MKNTLYKIGITLLSIFGFIILITNLLSGVVSVIWLIYIGRFSLLVAGILTGVVFHFIYPFTMIPSLLISTLAVNMFEKGRKIGIILLLPAQILNYSILGIWIYYIDYTYLNSLVYQEASMLLILLWGYAVTMSPIKSMAKGDNGFGTALGILFVMLGYLTFVIEKYVLWLDDATAIATLIIIGSVFVLFSMFVIFMSLREDTKQIINIDELS